MKQTSRHFRMIKTEKTNYAIFCKLSQLIDFYWECSYLLEKPQVTRRCPCMSKSDNMLLWASNTCSLCIVLTSYRVTLQQIQIVTIRNINILCNGSWIQVTLFCTGTNNSKYGQTLCNILYNENCFPIIRR